jgi:hypothetical protein
VLPLQHQTRAIPIVFLFVLDSVGLGLVQSLAQPGGNLTGFGAFDPPVLGKWLQFLKEIAPNVRRVAALFDPETQPYADFPLPRHRARRSVRRGDGDACSGERRCDDRRSRRYRSASTRKRADCIAGQLQRRVAM